MIKLSFDLVDVTEITLELPVPSQSYKSDINININTAGRLVGFAGCYAVIVLADNATFLLAVNRIAAFWSNSAVIAMKIISCCGSDGRASAPQSWDRGFVSHRIPPGSHLGHDFSTCLCPFRHTRLVRNFPTLASAERATPKPHSLKYKYRQCGVELLLFFVQLLDQAKNIHGFRQLL